MTRLLLAQLTRYSCSNTTNTRLGSEDNVLDANTAVDSTVVQTMYWFCRSNCNQGTAGSMPTILFNHKQEYCSWAWLNKHNPAVLFLMLKPAQANTNQVYCANNSTLGLETNTRSNATNNKQEPSKNTAVELGWTNTIQQYCLWRYFIGNTACTTGLQLFLMLKPAQANICSWAWFCSWHTANRWYSHGGNIVNRSNRWSSQPQANICSWAWFHNKNQASRCTIKYN